MSSRAMFLGVSPWSTRGNNWRYLPLSLLALVLASGCGPRTKVEMADVSGKVMFKGKPLPGGRITFISDKGAFASGGNIDEDGSYKLSAPVGDVHIQVDNQMLEKRRGPAGPILKRPDADDPNPVKGKYVPIPDKYTHADQSGLTYKVVSGAQTHDITLE